MATIQRNALVQPFSVRTPLLSNGNKGSKQHDPVSGVSHSHIKFFQDLALAVNATPQITTTIPANSNSSGQPGTIAFDSNWLYIAVGLNTWRRAALNVF